MSSAAVLMAVMVAGSLDAGLEQTSAMQNALAAVLHLQPMLSSAERFAAAKGLQADLDALARVEHGFRSGGSMDPGAQSIAAVLTSEIARARRALERGDTDNARAQLRGLTSLCFTCHTLSVAADLPTRSDTLELPPFERAGFLAATRHFDDALSLWSFLLKRTPATRQQGAEQIDALRRAIAVSVSVKDDPTKTLELIDSLTLGETRGPYSTRWLAAWRSATTTWALERFDSKTKTAKQLFVRGRALVEASHASQHILSDETQTIALLRATAYLTQALKLEPNPSWRSEALFALGVATATVREPLVWGLDGVYLEACIRENPGAPVAQRCFSVLMERTLFGFTGSSGTNLPLEVDERLRALATLATRSRPLD